MSISKVGSSSIKPSSAPTKKPAASKPKVDKPKAEKPEPKDSSKLSPDAKAKPQGPSGSCNVNTDGMSSESISAVLGALSSHKCPGGINISN